MSAFYKRFKNLELPGQEAVRQHFVNRAKSRIYNQFLHKKVSYDCTGYGGYECPNDYGLSHNEISQIYKNIAFCHGQVYEEDLVGHYTGEDFHKHLLSLEEIFNYLKENKKELLKPFNSLIEQILSASEVDIGITWKNGQFYPSGAKVLDEALVNDVLDWLDERKYANVKAPFQKALQHYLEAGKKPELLGDVITDMYEALEAFAKIATGKKDKDLSANRELFISKLKLSDIYKKMLRDYIEYANEYRHGLDNSKPRPLPKEPEVEAFVYQTGLFVRLGVKSLI